MLYVILALLVLVLILLVYLLIVFKKKDSIKDSSGENLDTLGLKLDSINNLNRESNLKFYNELTNSLNVLYKSIIDSFLDFKAEITKENREYLSSSNEFQVKFLNSLTEIKDSLTIKIKEHLSNDFNNFNNSIKENLSIINRNLNEKMDSLILTNKEKLNEIEKSVNKQLNDVLETSLKERFKSVFDNLVSVNQNITELKTVTSEITQVKALLSNVKTKGVIGEQQLLQIIQDILPPELYRKEYQLVDGSLARVDFVVKILDNAGDEVLLPIDSKFITTDYNNYLEALETNDKELIKKLRNTFLSKVRQKAKDIHDKYIIPPVTTSYALMFLPSDCLYFEIIQDQNTVEACRSYDIQLVCPSTIVPMLNTIRLGFTSYRISKQSQKLFDAVLKFKDDFNKYVKVLDDAKKAAEKTNEHLDKLSGIRSKAISKTLDKIIDLNENISIE